MATSEGFGNAKARRSPRYVFGRLLALAAAGLLLYATVSMVHTPARPVSAQGYAGTIISGTVPSAGFGLVVFGGGTPAQLVGVSRCTQPTLAFWATDRAGRFQVYIPATRVSIVNEAFLALFPGGTIPANAALLAKCT